MKYEKIAMLVCFAALLLVPLLLFNFTEDAVSEIDNRKLTGNPFVMEGDLSENVESYINDRIGLRDEMILSYTVLNDRLFGKMVHPSYSYGKDGYIFGAGIWTNEEYGEYHETFADMVKQLQDYCDARGVPFLMVFEPAKPAVLTQYLADGLNYDRTWVTQFLAALDARGVRYLDNTVTLREMTERGEAVFNQKYDANHWNALGAYYGTRAMLEILQQELPTIHVTRPEELAVTYTRQTSLPVSQFPIDEQTPVVSIDMQYENLAAEWLPELDARFRAFGYFVNAERMQEGAPKALVFQGSYMNEYGQPYLINAFGEYVFVHDYENVLRLPYYFNIYQPDCVIFEVAEYTLGDAYFSLAGMQAMDLNPVLADVEAAADTVTAQRLDSGDVSVECGETMTVIRWQTDTACQYAWLELGGSFDFEACEGGYTVTVPTDIYEAEKDTMQIVTADGNTLCRYRVGGRT